MNSLSGWQVLVLIAVVISSLFIGVSCGTIKTTPRSQHEKIAGNIYLAILTGDIADESRDIQLEAKEILLKLNSYVDFYVTRETPINLESLLLLVEKELPPDFDKRCFKILQVALVTNLPHIEPTDKLKKQLLVLEDIKIIVNLVLGRLGE